MNDNRLSYSMETIRGVNLQEVVIAARLRCGNFKVGCNLERQCTGSINFEKSLVDSTCFITERISIKITCIKFNDENSVLSNLNEKATIGISRWIKRRSVVQIGYLYSKHLRHDRRSISGIYLEVKEMITHD